MYDFKFLALLSKSEQLQFRLVDKQFAAELKKLSSLLIEKYNANPEAVNSENLKTYEKPFVVEEKDTRSFMKQATKPSYCLIS